MISERLLRALAQFEIKIWYFFFQAELTYAVSTIVGWGVANNFPADCGVQSGVLVLTLLLYGGLNYLFTTHFNFSRLLNVFVYQPFAE